MPGADGPKVELVYERSCPNVAAARRRLAEALETAGLAPAWSERDVDDPATPGRLRRWGSPTVLVNGRDVAGVPAGEADGCCRIYASGSRDPGVPPLDMLVAALADGGGTGGARGAGPTEAGRLNAALLPSVGAAVLPKLTCPACWPAYSGLLASMGVGFVNYTPYLLPLMATFLAVSIATLAYRAPRRRGYGPLILGLAAAALVLAGKFALESDPVMWAGLAVLVAASVWNTWPRHRRAGADGVAACAVSAGAGE